MKWLARLLPGKTQPQQPATTVHEETLRDAYTRECLGDVTGAERLYRQLLTRDATDAETWYFLGIFCRRHSRSEEAVGLLKRAAEIRPQELPILLELANALVAIGQFEPACAAFATCVNLDPACTAVRNNYAGALIELRRYDAARSQLLYQLTLTPDIAEVHFNLGAIYCAIGKPEEAIAAYRRGLALAPTHADAYSNLLLEMNYSARESAAAIFAEHRRFGERFATRYVAPLPDTTWPRRLRIGYISPDFRDHVVMRFMEAALERHDRQRFEIFCYHTHRVKDWLTEKLRRLDIRWADCEQLADGELAEKIRNDRIDILVDLAGHTSHNSLLALAGKPAPVQATYLGYPHTTGLGAIDVRITDALADPPGISDQYSVERLVRLPGSYFCYRPMPNSPAVGALPAASAGFITFGCFNNFPKLSTDFLDTTAQVLAAVPGSRLILKSRQLSNPEISDWVLGRFRQAGIELERIRLLGWAPSTTDHLAVYGAIDIALDSFPYNGATTTCESLWMGVPVVTVAGDRHAGRVGSSLLSAVGLEELIAHDVNHYIAKAKDLAGNLEKLARLRRDLRQRMQQSPVMDEAGFTRGLEQSYIQIWREYLDSRTTPTTADGRPVAELLADARRARAEGELTTASAVCEAILQSDPAHLEALTLRWDLAYDSGTPGAAIDWINRAISANNGARFHYMLGCVLQSQGKIEAAIASFQQSLALDAGSAKTHNNIGCLLEMAGNFPGAEQHYREAVRLDPAVAPAQYNLGNLYRQAGESELALEYIARALSIEPGRTDWICNLGDLRMRKGELDLAFELFNSALKIDSKFEPARVAMAESLLRSGRLPEAQEALAAAIQLAPGRADVASMLLAANLCDDRIEPKMLFEQHQAWSDRHATGVVRWSSTRRHRQGTDCLNVGYLVADLAQPLFASHLEPVLSAHDRKRFNIFCYATIGLDGEVARRAGNERTHWRDISQLQDPEAVMRIRADGIDILVDLVGHGPGGRLPLLARKPAPIQVSWIGYPASTGVAAVDYRLTDSIADPEGRTDRYYCERLVRLPGTYLCYQPDSGNPEITPPPQQEENRIVYGCFNPLLDITPRVIELWADILQRQAHSRLRVVSQGLSNQIARSTLLEKFSLHGIAQDRIELSAPQQSPGSRLDQYQQVDVVLDTSPVSGATNTCDSLWMGVPVVTLAGSQFASRTAASVLASLELGDYIATSPVHYVETAVAAGSDTDRRYKLRAGLRARMRNSELTNAGHFVAGLEAAYLQMHA